MINTNNRLALNDIRALLAQARHDIDHAAELLTEADRIALDIDPHELSAPYTTHTVSAASHADETITDCIEAIDDRLSAIGKGSEDPDYKPVRFNYYDGDGRQCSESAAVRLEIHED